MVCEVTREVPEPRPAPEDGCVFCRIANSYAPYDPLDPPSSSDALLDPEKISPNQPQTFMLLSTPLLMAFLDIAPLSRGHLLLCPRAHREKVSAVNPTEARELGYWISLLSAALVDATGVHDWNVVQNNGAAAAQVVPHAHFHIIPRPEIREQGKWNEHFTMFGRGKRTDLDDDEAGMLAETIRAAVARRLRERGSDTEPASTSKL